MCPQLICITGKHSKGPCEKIPTHLQPPAINFARKEGYNLSSPNQFGKDLQIKTADVRAQTLHYKDGVTQPSLAEDKYQNYFVLWKVHFKCKF